MVSISDALSQLVGHPHVLALLVELGNLDAFDLPHLVYVGAPARALLLEHPYHSHRLPLKPLVY